MAKARRRRPCPFLAASLPTASNRRVSGPRPYFDLTSFFLWASSSLSRCIGTNMLVSTPQWMTSQSQSEGASYLDSRSDIVAREFGTMTAEFCIADFSNRAYLPAMNRMAMSFGLDHTAGSPKLAARVNPSLSPSQVPCIDDTTGAISLRHLSNCLDDQEAIGQWRWTTSTGSSECRRANSFRAALP